MADCLLQVTGLTTWLGDPQRPVRVVEDLDLTLNAGETLALLGESGCGKSMTALSLMRLLPPGGRIVAGQARLGDLDLFALAERDMRAVRGGRLGMIFQEPQTCLNPVMTVGRQIAEAVELHDPSPAAQVPGRVVELLRAVGIPDPERRVGEYPHQLSGGMKQRIMIAMALAGRPELLIADEPTTALDVTIQAQVLGLLKALQRERGMAVLLITHDLGVVAETADRLAVMYAGQLVETGPVAEFFRAPAHPYSRKLFASLPGGGKRGQPLAVIRGMVPPLDQSFAGCRFADRCPEALPICSTQEPGWYGAGAGQRVRCHLWAPGASSAGPQLVGTAAIASGRDWTPEVLLEATDLRVHFPIRKGLLQRTAGWVKAVDGVDLALHKGLTLALVGESGCGKTTAGKALLQLVRPTGGQVRFGAQDLTQLKDRQLRPLRRELQIVFQDPFASMNPRMLIRDILEEGMVAQGIGGDREARRTRLLALLDRVGMGAEALNRYPHEFSGGQRQRLCIARALAVEPSLIVCDEPTSALDVSVQAQILNLLKELQRDFGLSYLFITHNISVVAYLAHQVAVMYLGRIVERGSVAEVLETPQHPYTQALLSAVPSTELGERSTPTRLEGDPPSPAKPPAGCHFHPRCPMAIAACREAYPEPVMLGPGREVRCIRVG